MTKEDLYYIITLALFSSTLRERMNIQVFSDPGCGSAWLEHLVWDQGVAGSNPVTPMRNLSFVFIFQKISTKLLTNDVG